MTDVELLEKHRGGCQVAFADLVRRHLPWVYGVARRRLRDAHQAEDVAQAVFILLHRKAPQFPADGAMMNWLHRTAWYASETAVRNQRRRQKYETEAAMMQPEISHPSGEWEELAPILDELVGRLNPNEREVVLLRYYRDLSFAEVAAQIETTEEAARKRTERAIDKLRQLAGKKGMEISGAALSAGLLGSIRIPPPTGLVATATTAATAPGGSALLSTSSAIVKGAGIMMASTKANLAVAGIVAAVLLTGSVVWVVTSSNSNITSAGASAAPTPAAEDAGPAIDGPQSVTFETRITQTKDRGWGAVNQFPKLSPFSAIEWRDTTPRVQVNGTWYEWVGLDDQPVTQIVAFAQQVDQKDWQKRIGEDLVELLARMGHQPGNTVKLQLQTLDTNTPVTLTDVPMTEANRQAVWRQRNGQ